MKKSVVKLGLVLVILMGIVSCKNEAKMLADKRIAELESFVDSLKAVKAEDMETNWDKIAADFDRKNNDANDAVGDLVDGEKNPAQEKIDASTSKYEELKGTVETSKEMKKDAVVAKSSPSQVLRDRLFGAGKIGNDMNFSWVNKDNILNVYTTFFQSYKDSKGNFSREDYDEVKLMYEALDNRKNTVENEGLTTEDNNKISSIKLKFGPMFKLNRMGAKSRETSAAKE